jgi:class 3 adenylate cyclase
MTPEPAITIDATIMFADLRGYTTLTQTVGQEGLSELLGAFYDDCAEAIWRHDGPLNKTIASSTVRIATPELTVSASAWA